MKLRLITLIIFTLSLLAFNSTKLYANCGGVLENGLSNWTVASNCTISNGLFSVWGVIDVNTRTVTINSNAALIVDWQDDRMTFTTGKVLMSGNAAIHDALLPENGWYNAYGDAGTISNLNNGITNCPSGTTVYNPIVRWNATSRVNASHRGRLICK